MPETAGGNWVNIAALVVSVISLLASGGIALVGWLARGLFTAIKAEIAELREDRRTAREEHREDQELMRKALADLGAKSDASIRRVHERIDKIATDYVQQAQCFVKHDDLAKALTQIQGQLSSLGTSLHSEIADILKQLAAEGG